jgi:CelD/BcsL family acetyltransferase involved in cellulose biosynthesis
MTLDRTGDPERVRRLLPELVALHRERDHHVGRRSDLDHPGRRAFYAAVVSRLADAGQVEVFSLRLDGVLAAYFLGLRDGPVFRSWDGRIGSARPDLSLGLLLRDEMVSALLAEPEVVGVDLCRGTLPHKMHGVTSVVPAVGLRAESSPRVARAVRTATGLRRWAREEVRRRVPKDLLRRVRGLDRPVAGSPEPGSAGAAPAEQRADDGAQPRH